MQCRWGRTLVVLGGLAFGGACGGEARLPRGDPRPDGAVDAGPDASPPDPEPDPPALPERPELRPCPAAWQESPDRNHVEIVTCQPYPAGSAACDGATARFPGGSGCEPLGTPCPAAGTGDWAYDLPADLEAAGRIVFVDPDAAGGGTGTRERPASTITRGLALAHTGDVVALARGIYDETLLLERAVTIWGACVEETIVAPSALPLGAVAAIEVAEAPGTTLRNLQVRSPGIGINVVASTEPPVVIDGALIDGAADYGLIASYESVVHARELVVRDVVAGELRNLAYGVEVVDGARVEIERGSIERFAQAGLGAAFEGSTIVARQVVVHAPLDHAQTGELATPAVTIADGAQAILEEVVLEGMRGVSVNVQGPDCALELRDSVVRGTTPDAQGEFGEAVSIRGEGTTASIERTWLADSHETALEVVRGADVLASHLVVTDTLPPDAGFRIGYGAESYEAVLALDHAAILRTHGPSLATGPGTLRATDTTVLDGIPFDPGDGLAYGLQADSGEVDLHRVRFERMGEVAMLVGDGTSLTAEDLSIAEVRAGVMDPWGRGIDVGAGASATLTRVSIDDTVEGGIVFRGAELTADHLAIRDTHERPCRSEPCPVPLTAGLSVVSGGHVSASRFLVARSALCGFQLAAGELDLDGGVVADNPVGICVGVDGYDLGRLRNGVVWRGNGRNFEAGELPIPEPSVALPRSSR